MIHEYATSSNSSQQSLIYTYYRLRLVLMAFTTCGFGPLAAALVCSSAIFQKLRSRFSSELIQAVKHHYSAISVSLKYDSVQFSITEHVRQFRRQLTPEEKAKHWNPNATWTQEKEETGKFVVKITPGTPRSVPSVFKEDDEPIEQSLHKFVAALVVSLAQVREYREKREAEERRRREEEERARQLEKERQAEIARKAALRGQAAAWREAAELREFVAAVREAVKRGQNFVPIDSLEEWSAWALEHADEIDPIASASVRHQR